jgi:hypothetical protein
MTGARRRVLLAPVTVSPTKPLTPTHLKYLLSLDVLRRATSEFADVTFLYRHATFQDSQQVTGFWSYLDARHPGRDFADLSEEGIGELYTGYHRARADGVVDCGPRIGGQHPASARLLDIWAEHYRLLGMLDPTMGGDGPPLLDTDDVLALLVEHGLCIDGRALGAPTYLDATGSGLPLRVVLGTDGRPNYLMPLLRELIPQALEHDLVVLAHDNELRSDYRTVAAILTTLGARVARFEVPRVAIEGVARSTRYGGWQGYTLNAIAAPLVETHGLDAFRLGIRLYLIAELGRTARDSFSSARLRLWVRRAARLLDRRPGDPWEPRVDLGAYLSAQAGPRGYADPYQVITTLLRRDPGVPTGELLHLVTSTAPAADELNFTQAVPRSSVHRHNATEVFLTDVRARDTQPSDSTPVHRFAAAALLPVAHPHYSAHTGAANRVLDPMLLLECCRQAETYAAHAFYGVEPDAAFVLKSWSLSLLPGAFAARPDLDEPTRLVIGARTHGLRMVAGAARGLVQDFDLWVAERPVGSARIEVGYLSRAAFTTLRARGRGTPPDVALYNPPKTEVAPWLVGRIRADDTLLLDLRGTADETMADLRLPTGNPSLLDHAHDHVPGTVLVEAARQLAAVAVDRYRGLSPDQTVMTGMSALFSAYAELDTPTTLRARATDGPITVEVVQGDARIAVIELALAPDPLDLASTVDAGGSARWARQPSLSA